LICRVFIVLILLVGIFFSCQYEEEWISDDPGLILQYSTDTLSFDTVFTVSGSITKRLTVRNPNKNAIRFDRIYLGRGSRSEYSITVAGIQKDQIFDQVIFGSDSMLVLVKVAIDPNDETLPFIVRDSILFEYNDRLDHVKLRSWGQNAHYLGDLILRQDQVWDPEIPYLLTGSILVDSLVSLTVRAGTRIYVTPRSTIFIKGSLKAEGKADNRILFRNERLDEDYKNLPGQWGGLIFLEGSEDNRLEYTDIRNAEYGLRIGTPDPDTIPDVIVKNVRIENTSVGGILAFTSDLWVENTLVDISAGYVLANLAGGNYHYDHCTFANYSLGLFRLGPSAAFSNNLVLDDNSIIDEPLTVDLQRSIIWGDLKEEITIEEGGDSEFTIHTRSSIFKTSLTVFEGNNSYISTDTDFMTFEDIENYNYTPDSLSPAVDHAGLSGMEFDLFGQERDSLPDIGAIEFVK
jgi:hypothetical protein